MGLAQVRTRLDVDRKAMHDETAKLEKEKTLTASNKAHQLLASEGRYWRDPKPV